MASPKGQHRDERDRCPFVEGCLSLRERTNSATNAPKAAHRRALCLTLLSWATWHDALRLSRGRRGEDREGRAATSAAADEHDAVQRGGWHCALDGYDVGACGDIPAAALLPPHATAM